MFGVAVNTVRCEYSGNDLISERGDGDADDGCDIVIPCCGSAIGLETKDN
jgi:hypothetical protein